MTAPATQETTPAATAATSSTSTAATQAAGDSQSRFNPDEIVDEMIDEKGGGLQGARLAAKKLLRDKGKLLEKVARLRARVVEEGAVVLKGDDLATYNAYRALNLTPKQISDAVAERDTLSGQVKAAEKGKAFDSAAESLGLSAKGSKAFARLARQEKLDIEFRDVTEDDENGDEQTVQKPFARIDGKGDFKPLDAVLKKDFGEFLPALYTADDDGDATTSRRTGDSGSGRGHAQERKVTPMATQSASGKQTPADSERRAVDDFLAKKYAPPTQAGTTK